jgi:type III secretory pathway component EscR
MMGSMFNNMSADNIRKSSIISLVSALFTLIGAILMWGLRKTGYYIYIAGILISIIAPFILMGSGLMGMLAGGFSAFIGILFIVLYGVNVRYMIR